MRSYRVLGFVALGAIVIAAFCFTVVDISIDSVNGCLGARTACSDRDVPPIAIAYTGLGALALVVAIVPAVGWIVGLLRRTEPAEPLPPRDPRPLLIEEDF